MKVTQSNESKECVLYTTRTASEPYGVTPVVAGSNIIYYGQRWPNFMQQPYFMPPDAAFDKHFTKVLHVRSKDLTGISVILKTEKDDYYQDYRPCIYEVSDQQETPNGLLDFMEWEGYDTGTNGNYLSLNNIPEVNINVLQSCDDQNMMTYDVNQYGTAQQGVSIDMEVSNNILDHINMRYLKVKNTGTSTLRYQAYAEMIFGYSRYVDFAHRRDAARSTKVETANSFSPFLVLPTFVPGWPRNEKNSTFYGYWTGYIPKTFADFWGDNNVASAALNSFNVTSAPVYVGMKMKSGVTNGAVQPFYLYYVRGVVGGDLPVSSGTLDNSRIIGTPALAVKGVTTQSNPLIHHSVGSNFYHSFSLIDMKLAVTVGGPAV